MPADMIFPMTDDEERLQKLSRDQYDRPLPKRFYRTVSVTDDLAIALDGRLVKTPLKAALTVSTRALAEAIAEEWRAQVDVINPGSMPLTRYANTAIDRATSEREQLIDELVAYAGADLVCYRAAAPPELVTLQNEHWDPVIDWAKSSLIADFSTQIGIVHHPQERAALAKLRARIESLSSVELTSYYNLTTLTGSALISLMLVDGALTEEQGWTTSLVDEDYQISQWGLDWEAEKRRAARLLDYSACLQFLRLARE
jgi:chaperone required for assembly of F1-ATPase